MTRRLGLALAALLAAEWAALAWLARGVTLEFSHGFAALNNILIVTGQRTAQLNPWRPPIPWLLVSPWIGAAFRFGGPRTALRAAHALMPGFLALGALVSFRLFSRRWTPAAAFTAAVLLAFNPLAVEFAPFALFDVFSMLDNTAFLLASLAFARRPSRAGWLVLASCYAATLLSRYHMAVLGVVPVLCVFFCSGARAVARSWVWLAPVAGGVAVCLLYLILPAFFSSMPSFWTFLAEVREFAAVHEGWADPLYLASLWRQLGPILFAAALAGLGVWVRRREPEDRCLLVFLFAPLVILSTLVYPRDQRYMLFALPVIYAAVAEGLELAIRALPARRWTAAAVCLAALAAAPWASAWRSARAVALEPAFHLTTYMRLADLLAAQARDGACREIAPGWAVHHRALDVISKESPGILIGAPELAFFLGPEPASCARRLRVVPREPVDLSAKPRWSGPELMRVYRLEGRGGVLVWRLFEDGPRAEPGGGRAGPIPD